MAQKIKKRLDVNLQKIHELVKVNDDRNVSITFQAENRLRNGVGDIAMSMGYTRRKEGELTPELTPAIVLLLEFGVAHAGNFRSWVANGKKDVVTLEASARQRKVFEKVDVTGGK